MSDSFTDLYQINSLDERFTFFNHHVYCAAAQSKKHKLAMLQLIEHGAHIAEGIKTLCRLIRNNNERVSGDDDQKPLQNRTISSLLLLGETACELHIEDVGEFSALLNAQQQEEID